MLKQTDEEILLNNELRGENVYFNLLNSIYNEVDCILNNLFN